MTAPAPRLRVLAGARAFARAAAEDFVRAAADAVEARGRFTAVLTGGSSPRQVFLLLAAPEFAARIDWVRTHLYFGDERCVPPCHPRSNFGQAARLLLSRVPIPPQNVHRMRGELGPGAGAGSYEAELRAGFGAEVRFDLMHLGLGEDGHILSLFPFHRAALTRRNARVEPALNRKLGEWRITLTAPMLEAARRIQVLVPGAEKSSIARRAIEGALDPIRLPAHLLRGGHAEVTWLLTSDAARELERRQSADS